MSDASVINTLQALFERLADEVAERAATLVAEKVANLNPGDLSTNARASHDDFVYCDEARKLLGGVSYMTLSRWDKTGYLPKYHVGRRVAYRRADIMKLIPKGGEQK